MSVFSPSEKKEVSECFINVLRVFGTSMKDMLIGRWWKLHGKYSYL